MKDTNEMKEVSKADFNPAMLILARESRSITQKELAEKLGVTQGWLSRVESGLREISDDILPDICTHLDYPMDFFFQKDKILGFGPTELFNRKRQSVSSKILQKIHAQINIRRIQLAKILSGVEMIEDNIPTYDIDEYRGSVEDIAKAVRSYWYVPPGPIVNLVQLIEDNGGIIIPFEFGTPKIDAMSLPAPGMPPLFFVNPNSPADRLRFTLAHELAHIVLHQRNVNPEMENQADRFAAQFLMPDNEIRPYLRSLTIQKLMELKLYWKVSMQALIMKATTLEMISKRQARTLWSKMGVNDYKIHEPLEDELPKEVPTLYDEIIDVYKDDMHYSLSEFSRLVNMNESEVENLYYYKPVNKLRLIK
ncbi:DNA-binding helix-turn-helix protein [Desulfitobacterium hafniense]|uniref:DNA-binding helix-turn-helix protein n=1 Tax=Desulfitobacterium hafniense TaxID=49338 RepID=A0A098AU82_DESHA|nr:ImmA/IrrE family metallo-endopeptidase [Desulfitobacterium hafniense]CDV96340.1 DNA-binding helix-turn-helix protein [Desulfitobacterium hafniense]